MKEVAKMLKNRIMLAVIAASAALVPLAGITVLTAGPAGATPTGIKCSTANGTANASTESATIKFSGCTGNTDGKGTTTGTEGATTGTIKWGNKDKTSFNETTSTGTNCPTSSIDDELVKGKVTSDNTGSTSVGAKVKGELCVSSSLAITLAPGTKFVIKP
jgi:hypothetical protein